MVKGKLLKAILICEAAGILGSVVTTPNINGWYAGLVKPPFNPPNWVFGPVWTILFLLMGIALYRGEMKKVDLKWFWIQLGLNFLWSIIFFGLKQPKIAAGEILFLIVAIGLTIVSMIKKDKIGAWLLVPYLVWVIFAMGLNVSIWILN